MSWDTVIRAGRWFDGTGGASAVRDLGIRSGRLAAVSETPLDTEGCEEVVDADGKWVMPGFIDIHTHYDAEVLLAPGLGESLRHGVTTVIVGSCSLGTVHVNAEDAADLFSRVEAIPHSCVRRAVEMRKNWTTAEGYITALESLPLGPNVASFLGHSDVRAAVMGLGRSTETGTRPCTAEMNRMQEMLEEALDAGFVGLSEMRSPWDKLGGQRYRSRMLPSTYAGWKEYRALHRILRREGRVLQSIPNLATPTSLAAYFAETVGLGLRPALKTSFLTAADVKANPLLYRTMGPIARMANGLGGDFRWQHLPVPFDVFADGIDLVAFEELGAGAAALHLQGEVRNVLIKDESYRRQFRREYDRKYTPRVWNRDFYDARILACPDRGVVGKTFGQVAEERRVHPVDAFLDLVVEYGTDVRWRTTIANHRPDVLNRLTSLPEVQMGFSDAGAHLRNMAFYNFPLRMLRRAHETGFMTIERAVHRLTGELADWYGLDAGTLREGDRADLVVVDPAGLDLDVDRYETAPVAVFGGLERMVNRNDRAVTATFVAGNRVFGAGEFPSQFGKRRTGRFLRAGEPRGTVAVASSTGLKTAL
jgi:N-acyl-D-aspartate/D-glutamate deacylase